MSTPQYKGTIIVVPPDDIYRVPSKYLGIVPPRRCDDTILDCGWCWGEARVPTQALEMYLEDFDKYNEGLHLYRPRLCCLACYESMRVGLLLEGGEFEERVYLYVPGNYQSGSL